MKLTKDVLDWYENAAWREDASIFTKKDKIQMNKIRNQILKNQEVVQRLKKRIEICKLPENNEDQEVLETLQKILEGKNA